jgi:TonB-linked SusC/RagA family outer membrane protein
MKKLKFIKFCLVFLLPSFVMAQQAITGKVTDNQGQPLPGVSILEKGTTNGTASDFDGNYELTPQKKSATLVYSYLGFATQEIVVSGKTEINIMLMEDASQLDEVVVVGYGELNKKDLTGSITSVTVNETVAQQNTTVDQLLQGRAAGVQVTQNAGSPGSGVSVKIRGASSLRGNNEPLYVVDGVIIASAGEDAQNAGDGNSLQENQNGLNGINPRDIESVQVLKDASATAIYGSRGANGVILITTKKGAKGKMNVSGYLNTTVSSIVKKIDVLSGLEFAQYRNEALALNGNNPKYHINDGQVYQIDDTSDPNNPVIGAQLSQRNWQDEIYKQGFSKSIGASFSGGSDNGNFYASVGYNDQGGIVENSRFQSGNVSINLNQDLSDKFEIDARFSAFYADGSFAQDGDRAGGGNRSFTNNLLSFNPLSGGDSDEFFDEETSTSGPLTWINDYEDLSEETRFRGTLSLKYKFNIKGLSYKLQAGGDIRDKERRRFYGPSTGIGRFTNGLLTTSNFSSKSYQINNLLDYSRTFNKKHRINAVAGVTYDVRNLNNTIYGIGDFSTVAFGAQLPNYGQSVVQPLQEIPSKTQLLSYLTRVNYTFDNKYIFTGTYRVDGSSKFSETNRYSAFPSFSFAWAASNESFLENSETLNNLKLRAGWGKTGNQAINPYQTFANYSGVLYGASGNATVIGFAPVNIGNSDLIWETTTQINVGVDFGLFNDRLFGSIDAYSKQTDDLLQLEKLPTSTGFQSLLINRGSLETKGLELTLSGVLVDKKDFNLEVGGNIAFSRNEILNLGIPKSGVYIDGTLQERSFYLGDNISSGEYFRAPANIFIEGEQVGLFYGYQTDGIYQTGDVINVSGAVPGDVKIIDLNEDGVINGADRTVIGNPNPDFIYGGYLNMSYKRLTLNVLLNGTYGNDIMNGTNVGFDITEGNQARNVRRDAYLQAWRPDAPSNTYPRIGYREAQALAVTDRQVEDGSFLRIRNITLGYDLPVEKTNIFSRANIYISGSNLFTFTDYSGYNPEITSFLNNGNIIGVDWMGPPNARSITFGLNLSF